MDIPREGQAKKRRIRNIIISIAVLALAGLATLGLSRLQPAAPVVEKETVWVDTVHRGSMLREVRGPGTLVPEDVRWISALVEGRVERIPALPGVTVQPTTVLLDLSNPEVEQTATEAESQVHAAQADYDDLKARLDTEMLNQEANVATVDSQSQQAKLQAQADEELFKNELIPQLTAKLSRLKADQLTQQAATERKKLAKNRSSAMAQLAAQRARVDQAHTLYELRRRQLDSLKVRSGLGGVLQELPVEVGQRVTPGTNLARVARPDKLKAELRIPETQAKDVALGQRAKIDTRNGIIPGHVVRVAPSATEGTVIVDVALDSALPAGARPNLSLDGTIEIERLPNVIYVGRPAYGQPNSKVEIFKLVKDGKEARRVPVQLGKTSVNTIEIVSGLQPGDQVILSDMSAYDNQDRLRLN
jgi:HlyD family secretion protein